MRLSLLGIACRHLLRGTRVPYTVALLIIGVALGSLGNSIDPDLLLAVFLPALLFESAFSMEVHQIKRCMAQMLLLAGPGVLISAFCLGSSLKLTFPYEWNWTTSLLLGGLLSATGPVPVVALLKELGAGKKLSTIIEGESLMNDGIAIVVYQLFHKMVVDQSFNWGAIIEFLAKVSLGAVGIGFAFGIVSALWLGFIFNDKVIEIALTLAVSYIAYFTAQQGVGVSGILAVMTLGIICAAFAKTAIEGDGQQRLHHFWELVAYIANTLIFILSGVIIAEGILHNDRIFENGFQSARVIVTSECSSDSSPNISSETGSLFIFFTGGIVFLTLVLNGSTAQFILHFLDMDKLSTAKFHRFKYSILHFAVKKTKNDKLCSMKPGGTTASCSHQQSWYQFEARGSIIYQVETRARVIIFYIPTLEADSVEQKSPSSFNHSHRTLSRGHRSLMSWPELFYKARQHTQIDGATDQQANRLSARELQLSIFGSMVDMPQRR
ncbi:hypothetical protein DITRI_Ditri12bG0028700 [Diplodiscus trichospermus]